MEGTVSFFSFQDGVGSITGSDGKAYMFSRSNSRSPYSLKSGACVLFEADGQIAKNVRLATDGDSSWKNSESVNIWHIWPDFDRFTKTDIERHLNRSIWLFAPLSVFSILLAMCLMYAQLLQMAILFIISSLILILYYILVGRFRNRIAASGFSVLMIISFIGSLIQGQYAALFNLWVSIYSINLARATFVYYEKRKEYMASLLKHL